MTKQDTPEAIPVQAPVVDLPAAPTLASFDDTHISTRYDDVYQDITPGKVTGVRWNNGTYQFFCDNRVTLLVQVHTSGIVRLRYSADGDFAPDFSYATDPGFEPEKITVTLHETENEYLLVSEILQVVIAKAGLEVRFFDANDYLLCEDAGGFSARRTIMSGPSEVRMEKKCHKKEVFFGLGSKGCGVNLAGKKLENWNTDSYAFGRQTDPLYLSVPVYYSLHQGIAYGIFFDNPYKTHFDFDAAKTGTTAFWADGGELNYYFIYGPSLEAVVRNYARLTGYTALPPMWAIGYHQSRWSYYPEQQVRQIADTFRALQIPCDALYFDIDYMDGYRCFTWDDRHFPDPKQLISDLKQQGFQTVAMIDPGIKEDPDYFVYQEGIAQGHFVRTSDGAVAKAPVWPGFCAFPDFTHPDTRRWWGNLYEKLYNQLGVSGFWNDMNEPAVFYVNHKTLPDSVLHHYEGHPCSHRKAHNIYGLQMTRASWEGYQRLQPDKRPYLLTRATFSGGQRYAAVWTGDNVGNWEHLQVANTQCQRLAISGFSFCGSDIGGFTGVLNGELLVRWLQLAVFHPLMRIHSMGQHISGDALAIEDAETHQVIITAALHDGTEELERLQPLRQEPWSFGEKWTPLAKKAIELRYCLLPCLYTAMRRAATDGTPVLQHLAFADPLDPRFWEQERDFLFAEHLLVSPVIQPKIQLQNVCLPKRTHWYYFWSGQCFSGDVHINVKPEEIPFFVREGGVLPIYPIRQWTGEKPVEELTLYVYYKNGSEISHLYEDTGEGYDYQNGVYSLKVFETAGTETSFSLRQRHDDLGLFRPEYKRVKVFLVGFPVFVRHCSADDTEVPIREIRLRERSLYTLEIEPGFREIVWRG